MNTPDDLRQDNTLAPAKNALIVHSGFEPRASDIQQLADHFFGEVIVDPRGPIEAADRRLYICGALDQMRLDAASHGQEKPHVIEELSCGHHNLMTTAETVELGQVPISVHGLGVLFPEFFKDDDFFGQISAAHHFQQLTESSKPSLALRTGIYLSAVTRASLPDALGALPTHTEDAPLKGHAPKSGDLDEDAHDEVLKFHLMRCSSNLTGPTDNFRDVDWHIIHKVNDAARHLFEREAPLNHVLAQIYENKRISATREKKARIGAHSDKTKDMHPDGVMAFCSFYRADELEPLERGTQGDPFDRGIGKNSGLCRLVFKRKKGVEDPALVAQFSVTLYPRSVFFIPLATNRLYTHEIRPSALDVARTPTRMGYVVRCSDQEAFHTQGHTFIHEGQSLVRLAPMDATQARQLRTTYFEENSTHAAVQYGRVHFSMNAGDYMKPLI